MRIAIIYCSAGVIIGERRIEQLAEQEVLITALRVQETLEALGHQAQSINLCNFPLEGLLAYDWVFNLVETTIGYPLTVDEVTAWLENAGLPYTGAGSQALKICADKAATKDRLQKAGILTPRFEVFGSDHTYPDGLAYPLIVKPIHEEGSIGITEESIVHDTLQLNHQVEFVLRRYGQPALVEEYIDGLDVSVSLLGSSKSIQVLPLSEISFATDFTGPKILTYNAKWVPETQAYKQSSTRCPSTLDIELQQTIAQIAIQASQLFDCQDYTRIDFRVNGNIPYILEINPNPCINPEESGFVQSAHTAGLSFEDIVEKILFSSHTRNVSVWNSQPAGRSI